MTVNNKAIEAVLQGTADTKEEIAYVFALHRQLSDQVDKLKKSPVVIDLFSRPTTIDSFEIKSGVVYTQYRYDLAGHPLYNQIIEMINELDQIRKSLEEEMQVMYRQQTSPVIGQVVSYDVIVPQLLKPIEFEESGEVVTLNPIQKVTKPGIKITKI